MSTPRARMAQALWRIYNRPVKPLPWGFGGNLPWNEADFSRRMLQEHLDESHGAASRVTAERRRQVEWLWRTLGLQPGGRLLDVTCGPGLYAVEFARRGVDVTGVDFSPASIAYAGDLAVAQGVSDRCVFVEQDVRQIDYSGAGFDAALFIYGQLAVFTREEAQRLLGRVAASLKPGGRLCVELLNQERVDKQNNNWWYTDDKGLWGDAPFLCLGERFWHEDEAASLERYHIIHLETGQLDEIYLCDQTYAVTEVEQMMREAGFSSVYLYPDWDGLNLYDAAEWIVYVAER